MDTSLSGFKKFMEDQGKPKKPGTGGTVSLDSQGVEDQEFGVKDPSWRKDVQVSADTKIGGKIFQDFSGFRVLAVDRDMVTLQRIVTGNKVYQRTPSGQLANTPNPDEGQDYIIMVPRKQYAAWRDRGLTQTDMGMSQGGDSMSPMGGIGG